MKRKPTHAKRFLFKFYARWDDFRWFWRFNLCWMPAPRCVEFTIGLVGVGLLAQLYYGKRRIDLPAKRG